MDISKEGLERLEQLEGCVLHTYRDSAGLLSIGIGHCLTTPEKSRGTVNIAGNSVIYAQGITREQVVSLLHQDLRRFVDAVNDCLQVEVTQNQFDALAIFCFNIGEAGFRNSSALHAVNEGRFSDVGNCMKLWNKVTVKGEKVVDKGLVNRRAAEVQLFYA